jgi:hypothetical protein
MKMWELRFYASSVKRLLTSCWEVFVFLFEREDGGRYLLPNRQYISTRLYGVTSHLHSPAVRTSDAHDVSMASVTLLHSVQTGPLGPPSALCSGAGSVPQVIKRQRRKADHSISTRG